MDKIKTRAVKNKNVAIKLVNAGHELLNITKSYDDGKPCFIFEDTEAFRVKFDELLESSEKSKKNESASDCDLTWVERQYLIKLLENRKQECQSMGVNVDTIDTIIGKLKYKIDEVAANEVARNNGRVTYLEKSNGILDRQKILDMMNSISDAISQGIRDMAVKNMKAINQMNYPWMDK